MREEEKRKKTIYFLVNREEWEKACKLKEKSGLTMSKVMRSLVLERELKEQKPRDYLTLLEQVDEIANDVNQIALQTHHQDTVKEEEVKKLSEEISRLQQIVHRWGSQWA